MILNSKSEFDRCKIPRLVLEEQEEIEKLEKLEAEKLQERMATLDMEEEAWGAEIIVSRNNEIKARIRAIGTLEPAKAAKREQEPVKWRRAEKLKYAIMGADWGRKKPEKEQLKKREQPNSPLSTPNPISSPPPGSQITSSPAQMSPKPKEQRVKKAKGAAQGERGQLKLAGWLVPHNGPGRKEKCITVEKDISQNELTNRQTEGVNYKDILSQKTTNSNQTDVPQPDSKIIDMKTTPSVCERGIQEKARCEVTRRGFCQTHNCHTESISVTSKKWRDRGGGRGFGYVSVKVKKYVCKAGSLDNKSNSINPDYDGRGPVNMEINDTDKSESFSEK